MASNRRRSLRKIGNYVNRLDRRLRRLSRRPAPRRIGERTVTTEIIDVDAVTTVELAPDSVTTEILAPGAVTIEIIDEAAQDELGGIDSTSSGTAPASPAEGDFWIDTSDNNNLKRYNGSAWVSVRDITIATAQSAATAAQATADGKNKVFRQASTPTATATGDVWFDSDDDNKIYRWDGSSWVASELGSNAIASLSASKITAGTIDASVITVSNINAANISSGTIASARITSSSIAAGVIDASKIIAGELGASVVYSGTINAGNITTGTLSGISISSVNLSASSFIVGGRILLPADGGQILLGTESGGMVTQCYIFAGGSQGLLVDTNASGSMWIAGQSLYPNNTQFTSDRTIVGLVTGLSAGTGLVVSGGQVYRLSSKRELKENIQDFSDVALIDELRPRLFTWKVSPSQFTEETEEQRLRRESSFHVGFIAEEVEEASDGLLSIYNYEEDGHGEVEMYKYLDILALAVANVKDLRQRVTALESAQTPGV